ncbi:MAG TPA: Uma2 family endonuclease [Xanthobacteraceae bacterium]|nr:Uma2 family endonuclease [Xanthobacteraceae bacterium]
MGVPRINTGPMTVDEFYLLTDTRPDGEKWELIDGEPILNASPSPVHQLILKNLIVTIALQERSLDSHWTVTPGIGALVSETSRPEPDAMILPHPDVRLFHGERDTDEAIVLFEIMSPSTRSRDLKWKRAAYTSLPSLTHYVVIAQDAVDVVVFDRAHGFDEKRDQAVSDVIDFPALGISLSLSEIYRRTGLA